MSAPVTVTVKPTSTAGPPSVWASPRYPDVQAAIDFLVTAFGFEPTELVPSAKGYAHVELRWPLGSGGVMIGPSERPVPAWLYVITDDPDGLYEKAVAAGATVERPLGDTDYGSRTFSVVDPWQVHWSFGTYTGV